MFDKTLSGLKCDFAEEVYEKFKEESFQMEAFYSVDRIYHLQLTIELIQNNIDPYDIHQ